MFKAVSLVKKNPSLSDEEFAAYWIDQFAPVAARLPGLRRYVVNVTSAESHVHDWDGITELWFDSRVAYVQAFEPSVVNDQLDAMRPAFIADYRMYFVEEVVIEVPAGGESRE